MTKKQQRREIGLLLKLFSLYQKTDNNSSIEIVYEMLEKYKRNVYKPMKESK